VKPQTLGVPLLGRFEGNNLPMVGIWLVGKWSSENLSKMQLLPTEESPMMISLIR